MRLPTISTSKLSRRKYTDKERKERAAASRALWVAKNPKKHRERHIKNRYGITLQQRDNMFAEQGGVCAVCGGDDPQKGGQDWAVDHCHSTGKVRGILCHPCNAMLGLARDNITTLAKAIQYLQH